MPQPILPVKLIAFALGLTAASCASQAQRTRLQTHTEDLSRYRPVVKDTVLQLSSVTRPPFVPPQHTVNTHVDAVLDSIDKINLMRKFVDGFTIQIYSGQKREDAALAKKKIADELPYWRADLQFQQPTFRVKTGAYFTRLDAQKDLVRVRKIFPNAILVPEKIMLRN
jgi:arginine deiminase